MRIQNWLVAAVVALGVVGLADAAHAQTATANFTWTNPTDAATQTYIDYGSGAGCNPTSGCSSWTPAPGSPVAGTATQFSQPGLATGVLACWRFIRKGGGASDGDPLISCGTPPVMGKNGQPQNMILIFSPASGTQRSAPSKTPTKPTK